MTDVNGNQIGNTVKYLPFGETRMGSVPTDKLFTGQRLDSTGLYYYNARYYDPTIGRFISPDTFVQNPANPQCYNRYSYCLNNPLKYTDPSGHGEEQYWKMCGLASLSADQYDVSEEAYSLYNDVMGDDTNYPISGPGYYETETQIYSVAYGSFGMVIPIVIDKDTRTPNKDVSEGMAKGSLYGLCSIEGIGDLLSTLIDACSRDTEGLKLDFLFTVLPGNFRWAEKTADEFRAVKKATQLVTDLGEWVGDGAKYIKNKAGDSILYSEITGRKVRLDVNKFYPHEGPHMHFEVFNRATNTWDDIPGSPVIWGK